MHKVQQGTRAGSIQAKTFSCPIIGGSTAHRQCCFDLPARSPGDMEISVLLSLRGHAMVRDISSQCAFSVAGVPYWSPPIDAMESCDSFVLHFVEVVLIIGFLKGDARIRNGITNRKMVYDLSLVEHQIEMTVHFVIVERADASSAESKCLSGEVHSVANGTGLKVYIAISPITIEACCAIEFTNHREGYAGVAG